jgi:hypothetical protein
MIVRPYAPPLTVAEYRNLPETGPRYQLIEGDLYTAPAPSRFHQDISRNLEVMLANYLSEHPIGVLYDAPFDVYLTDIDVFQPDLLIVLNENRGILTDAGAEGAPDLVVEVLSPKTRQLDLVKQEAHLCTYGCERALDNRSGAQGGGHLPFRPGYDRAGRETWGAGRNPLAAPPKPGNPDFGDLSSRLESSSHSRSLAQRYAGVRKGVDLT